MNEYIGDQRRGVCVFHDHFVGEHGGVAVFDVRTDEQRALLDDPGPLTGWSLSVHGLTFSLAAIGFIAQAELTMREYSGVTLEQLRAADEPAKRHWWNRPEQASS
jgi:hypothetical protein